MQIKLISIQHMPVAGLKGSGKWGTCALAGLVEIGLNSAFDVVDNVEFDSEREPHRYRRPSYS
jgi:hypothetical protein